MSRSKTGAFSHGRIVSGLLAWECESSIPAAPAKQSLDLRLRSIYTRNACNLRGIRALATCLQALKIGNFRENLPKVSSPNRKNSRFGEIIGGDWFDHDCRPTTAHCFDQFLCLNRADSGVFRLDCRLRTPVGLAQGFRCARRVR